MRRAGDIERWKSAAGASAGRGLVDEDTAALRRIVVHDLSVNPPNREGDQILAMKDGNRQGMDHGLTFHSEHKLQIVPWGWVGEELTPDGVQGIARVREDLKGGLTQNLVELLPTEEVSLLIGRWGAFRANGRAPGTKGGS